MSGPIIPSHLTWHGQPGSGTEEAQQGRRSYLECLADLHRILQPRRYLEIGIRHGRSLALASCESVGVDPDPQLEVELGRATRVVEQTSDDFFQQYRGEPFDLIFVDGMHLFECVLRDLINSERAATPNT